MIAPNLGYGNILTLDLSCSRKRFVLSLWAAENFCPLTWEGTNCCEETESLECRLLSRRGYRILVSWGVAKFLETRFLSQWEEEITSEANEKLACEAFGILHPFAMFLLIAFLLLSDITACSFDKSKFWWIMSSRIKQILSHPDLFIIFFIFYLSF